MPGGFWASSKLALLVFTSRRHSRRRPRLSLISSHTHILSPSQLFTGVLLPIPNPLHQRISSLSGEMISAQDHIRTDTVLFSRESPQCIPQVRPRNVRPPKRIEPARAPRLVRALCPHLRSEAHRLEAFPCRVVCIDDFGQGLDVSARCAMRW